MIEVECGWEDCKHIHKGEYCKKDRVVLTQQKGDGDYICDSYEVKENE